MGADQQSESSPFGQSLQGTPVTAAYRKDEPVKQVDDPAEGRAVVLD